MKKNYILLASLLAGFEALTYLSTDMYLPALPQIQTALGLSSVQTQLTLTWWFIGSSALQLFLGPTADRWGRRPILLGGCIIFVISTLVCAYTSSHFLFLICRFLQGCTVSTAIVAGYATIHELLDTHQAIKTVAWMEALTIIGPAIGPLIGAIILTMANWPAIFIALGLSAALILPLLIYNVPETLQAPHSINFKKIGSTYLKLYSNVAFLFPCSIACFSFCGFIAWISASPLLLMTQFHLTPTQFSLWQALMFSSYLLSTRFIKPLSNYLAISKLILLGMSIRCIGSICCIFSLFLPHPLIFLAIGIALYPFGAALASSSTGRAAMESTPFPMASKVALFSFTQSAFGILGSIIISYIDVQIILGLCGILPLIIYFFWAKHPYGKLHSLQ